MKKHSRNSADSRDKAAGDQGNSRLREPVVPGPVSKTSPRVTMETLPLHYGDEYDIPHVLARVRFMRRYFHEVVDQDPVAREIHAQLHCAYMDMLQEDLAPYALDLAMALIELEDEVAEQDGR